MIMNQKELKPMPDSSEHVGNYQDEEIDLGELFSKVWRRRVFIVGFVIIVSILISGMNALSYLQTPATVTYSETIRFNFPSSVQGKYPSGQSFSNNDLVSTAVLKQVYENNNLDKFNIGFSDFAANFSIAPYASNSHFIQTKYQSLLGNKKLSRTEVEELEKQYQNELQAAQANFAKLAYVENTHLGLTPSLIEKILNDVPKAWSEISIRDLGVLDLKIPGKQFYQPELVEQYEYLQSVQYMRDSADRFDEILQTLQNDEIGGFVRDPETGLVVSDLRARLNSIKEFDLEPIFSVIANLGLVKDSLKATQYLINQIEIKQDQISELKGKEGVIKEAITIYQAIGDKQGLIGAPVDQNSNMGMVQYGDGFLSKIVGMVEQQKDTEYRQQLLSKNLELALKRQSLITSREKLKRALNVLNTNADAESNVAESYSTEINKINQNITNLIDAYQRILEVRNIQVLGKTSSLYAIASDKISVESNVKSKIKKLIMITSVTAVLALMLAVFIALVVSERKAEK